MIIDSIYSGNEDIACHHCIPIGIIRLSVINSLSNLNGSHTISSIPFFFLSLSSLVEAGIFIARTCRHRFCNGSRSVNEDRCFEMRKRYRHGVYGCYVKLECFSVS